METSRLYSVSKINQYLVSVALVGIVSALCYPLSEYLGYRTVALILLVTVSIVAMLFELVPVLLAAILSALIWDFFFIPPVFTLAIDNAEDLLMFLMYFVIALLNAVFSYKARKMEKTATLKEEKSQTLRRYDTLIKSISTELDTNLTQANSLIDTLKKEANREKLLSDIAASYSSLSLNIKNLLYSSRFEAGPLHPRKEWTDMGELILHVVKQLEKPGISKQIHINIPSNFPVFNLDASMMELAIYNLLSHMVKNIHEKSQIDVYTALHINVLQIVFEDNHNGFTKKEVEILRNPSKSTEVNLGLSVSGRIIEIHGGIIRHENNSQKESKLILDIPVQISNASDAN